MITLSVVLGQGDHMVTMVVEFLVVDLLFAYNAIIDRPLTKKTRMVTIVYYLTIKFLTPIGIGYIKVDQATER